jgi:ABC-type spermidine/putrescine transport system permease subunit II
MKKPQRSLLYLYLARLGLTSIGLLIVFILLYPLLYVIISSLIRGQVIATGLSDATRYGLSLQHYLRTIRDSRFISATITSVTVAVATIIFSVLVITPAAYVFSRFRFSTFLICLPKKIMRINTRIKIYYIININTIYFFLCFIVIY